VPERASRDPARHLASLALLAIAIMAPVTMPVPVLRELVHDRFSVSELATSLFMSVNMVGALVAAPLAGAVADRLGRRRVLLVAALLLDALCFFVLASRIPFELFLAVRFAEGCAHITALSVLLSLAAQALGPERRGRAMGLVGGSMMLGVALGAPLGGALGRTSAILPLEVGGGVLLAAAGAAALLVAGEGEGAARPGFREIAAALRERPAILVPLAFSFVDRFTVGFFTTTFSLYVRRIHELPPGRIGLAIAIFMLPFALLSYPVGRIAERGHVVALLCTGSLLYAAGTACVGATAPPGLYVLMFGLGVTAAVMFVPSLLLTIQLAPEAARATALGAFNAAGSLGFVAGPLAGGWISQSVAAGAGWEAGYRAAFAAAGASVALCVAAALPVLLRLRPRREA
jgi:DHA1 family tetracycline resistance protein-like MFS transporter